jgi:hypothetical protein
MRLTAGSSSFIILAAEIGPAELSMRGAANRMGRHDLPVWQHPVDALFVVACDLQMRQTRAVAKHDGLYRRTAQACVEAHLAPAGGRRGAAPRAAQGWY